MKLYGIKMLRRIRLLTLTGRELYPYLQVRRCRSGITSLRKNTIIEFSALWTTRWAGKKGQDNKTLPISTVTRVALRSLSSVALSSAQVTEI
jgi:hypothetical protein